MAKFIIQGRKEISGVFTPVGNKNAALPMLAACLLTDDTVTLHNLPLIKDVLIMLELLAELGVTVEQRGRTVALTASGVKSANPDPQLCKRVRGSVLLAGPLTSRWKKTKLAPPGGDVIGRRRLDTHFYGFGKMGAQVEWDNGFVITRNELIGTDILLDEASVTATENLIMAATLAKGKTTLFNAACEPHVQDLCALLVKMGADIQGIGTNFVTIRGKNSLGSASHRIAPDYIEAASFIAASAVTGGELSIPTTIQKSVLQVMQHGFSRLGVEWQMDSSNLVLPRKQNLAIREDLGNRIPKLEDGTWPSFPSDLMSIAIVVATQARGSILFFEKMFESRMYFVDRLIEMGARIVQCDPHRVMVVGSSSLQGSMLTSPDIRAGMALIIAALCAKGESIIDNAQMIDRGYERIEERLRDLGADIERVD